MSNGKPANGSARGNDRSASGAEVEKIDRHMKDLRAFDVRTLRDRWDPRLETLQKGVNLTLATALGANSPEYRQYQLPAFDATLDATFGDRYTMDEARDAIRQGMDVAIGKLISVRDLLTRRLEKGPDAPAPAAVAAAGSTPAPTPAPPPAATPAATRAPAPPPTPAPAPATRPTTATEPATSPMPAAPSTEPAARGVAIVGQRGESACDAANRFVTQLGVGPVRFLEPDAVSDEPLVARLESLRSVGFAILVPSADPAAQALEIGFLLGALGRDRVLLLTTGPGEKVPALEGVASHAMDQGGIWPLLVARQMKQAGLDVDLNRAV
jgi:hypothetical protein